jgi:hypothetical protein
VGYELEDPLRVFFIAYLAILSALVLYDVKADLGDSFKLLKYYGHNDSNRLINTLENLVIVYSLSNEETKSRILLLGYVSQYQNRCDRHQDSMISFHRLKGKE